MKNMKMALIAISSAATLGTAAPAIAQNSPGLIRVNISEVKNMIAERLNVEAGRIPETVDIHVGVAAEVCNVAANVLGEIASSGDGTCTAKIVTPELNGIVRRHVQGIAHEPYY